MIDDFSRPSGASPAGPPEPKNEPTDEPPTNDASADIPADATLDTPPAEAEEKPQTKKKRSFRIWPSHLSKKKQIALAVLLVIIIGGIVGYFVYSQLFSKPAETTYVATPAVEEDAPAPTTEASRLTGTQIKPELNKRPVTAVMIENSPDARPQSGLLEAGIVFEAVAEGGITRFMAMYQESQPQRIGPVRSARPYYLDWLMPFDAAYAHVGGSPQALQLIRNFKIKDLDQFANAAYYQRIPERYAPHNMYTSMKQLDAAKKARGYTKSNFNGFERKDDEPTATATVKRVNITMSSTLYNVQFDYSAKSNKYKRSMGGQAHKDEKSGAQIAPKVVIALVTTRGQDGKYSVYKTTGSGRVFIYQDGTVIKGTWKKPNKNSQLSFIDSNGNPIKLNAGQTWITAVESTANIKTKP